MLRYTIINRDTISIDLKNGYKVIALTHWNNVKNQYYVTLMMHEKSINNWSLIEKVNHIPINANHKTVKKYVANLVTDLLTEGFFKEYIDRYEYELKCFDRGNELFEMERLRNRNV